MQSAACIPLVLTLSLKLHATFLLCGNSYARSLHVSYPRFWFEVWYTLRYELQNESSSLLFGQCLEASTSGYFLWQTSHRIHEAENERAGEEGTFCNWPCLSWASSASNKERQNVKRRYSVKAEYWAWRAPGCSEINGIMTQLIPYSAWSQGRTLCQLFNSERENNRQRAQLSQGCVWVPLSVCVCIYVCVVCLWLCVCVSVCECVRWCVFACRHVWEWMWRTYACVNMRHCVSPCLHIEVPGRFIPGRSELVWLPSD